jgi:hypothetical protein
VSEFLRRAGSTELADGARLVWTVADGSRGRRWRAVATVDDAITHALLLEVALEGTVTRLELATPSGLLTLHPEADCATLHGNVVSAEGVRHLSFAWGPDHALVVAGRPIADAVTGRRLEASVEVGEGMDVPAILIAPGLEVSETRVRFDRVTSDTWRLASPGGTRFLTLDPSGSPFDPEAGQEWPLELD